MLISYSVMKRLEVFVLSLKGILRPLMPIRAQTHTTQYNLKVSLLVRIRPQNEPPSFSRPDFGQ